MLIILKLHDEYYHNFRENYASCPYLRMVFLTTVDDMLAISV